VALVKKKNKVDDYFCGGALISRLYVLTASHCIERENASNIRVALGAHDSDNGPEPVAVSKFIMHPKYYRRTYLNDIALVKLQEPATLSETVRVICLPTSPVFTSPNDTAVVAGWGWNRYQQGKSYKQLQELELPILSPPTCVSKYGGVIQETNLCAGGLKDKTHAP
ncbi:vitamin K-dependent protein C, partial [Trichonephila clavata]